MWRFIIKVIAFGFALIGSTTLAVTMMPYGWENPEYYRNLSVFKDHYQFGTNTLFFGSSRTMRNVDPVAFDRLNALKGIQTQSYMLASSAVLHNEQFYLIREFLADKPAYSHLKYVFVELDDEITIPDYSQNTIRGSYFIQWSDLFTYIRQIFHLPKPLWFKFQQSSLYFSMMVKHRLYLGHGHSLLKHLGSKTPTSPTSPTSTQARKGYKPLSPAFPEYQHSTRLQDDREKLMKDTFYVQRNFQRMDSLNHSTIPADLYNPVVLETYLAFITDMQTHGIHVICLMPIRRVVSPSLISLSRRLPPSHVINMTTHPDIGQLNAVKYWFDPGHLTIEGSRIYTRLLGQKFESMMVELE